MQATRADLVTDAPPRPAHLAELVPDAPHVALPVPAAEEVGTVAGTAGVEGGAAIYTIDIPVPPGRRGMEPEIALTYSSRTGSGVAGVGWSSRSSGIRPDGRWRRYGEARRGGGAGYSVSTHRVGT